MGAAALVTVPVLPFPEASATDVPEPSPNEYAATKPVGGGGPAAVVTDTTDEYPLTFRDGSTARTR
jgi:hypothetical protein